MGKAACQQQAISEVLESQKLYRDFQLGRVSDPNPHPIVQGSTVLFFEGECYGIEGHYTRYFSFPQN